MVRGNPHTEEIFVGGYFSGHIGSTSREYEDVHGSFGFGDRNDGGVALLDFTKAFDLVVLTRVYRRERSTW